MKTKMASSEDEQAELSERNIIKNYFDLGYKYSQFRVDVTSPNSRMREKLQ